MIDILRARRTRGPARASALQQPPARRCRRRWCSTPVVRISPPRRRRWLRGRGRGGARLAGVYRSIARLLNCAPDEIALGRTPPGLDMGVLRAQLRPGDRILTARTEYASNYLAFLQVARPATSDEVVRARPTARWLWARCRR